jgi:uncharacterized protein YqjF (DUF2071 family)
VLADDFNHRILDEVAHRPWPMPEAPWIMTQTWHDLLFAHWPVDAAALASKIPSGLELDMFEGQAWIGIVPFHITNLALRMTPALPWLSAFPELNVRTYVKYHGEKPGVFFFSLDAGNPVAVQVARTMFRLPYYLAKMEVDADNGSIRYRSCRTHTDAVPAEFAASYRPTGAVFNARAGTLDYFLTERYCLYTVDSNFYAYRLEIHHPLWPLQPAQLTIDVNTMADAAGIRLPSQEPLLHFSKRQDMVGFPLTRLD